MPSFLGAILCSSTHLTSIKSRAWHLLLLPLYSLPLGLPLLWAGQSKPPEHIHAFQPCYWVFCLPLDTFKDLNILFIL